MSLLLAVQNSYSYKTNTGNTVIKHKGITMDAANSKIVTFETMRDMVLDDTSTKSEDRYIYIQIGR